MFIQVKNVKFIFNNNYENVPTGAEVDYTVVLNNVYLTGRTLAIPEESHVKVVDVPDDIITGKITILNTTNIDTASFTLWDFSTHIYKNIMNDITGGL